MTPRTTCPWFCRIVTCTNYSTVRCQSRSCGDSCHNITDLLLDLRNILCRHIIHPRGEPAQWSPQSKLWNLDKLQYDRHFHGLFTWLKLYPRHLSWNLRLRLIDWTQSLKIIVLVHINQFPSALVEIECVRSIAILSLATRIPDHQSISVQARSH